MVELRPYQRDGVERIRSSFAAGRRRPIYVLPTGGGKTVTFCYITAGAASKSRVLILVHRRELIWQTCAALAEWDVPHGVILSGEPMTSAPVQVASVQTLIKRLDVVGDFGLIIVDEAHHAVARQWTKVFDCWPNAPLLGVTASPARLDGKPLGDVFDDLVIGPTVTELQALGHLAKVRVLAPSAAEMQKRLKGVKVTAGDYNRGALDPIMRDRTVTGDAVRTYGQLLAGKPSIAFCVSVRHAEEVAQQFREAGWVAVSVDGDMRKRDREAALNGLANGQINVITSCDLISEGLDVPLTYGIIGLRPTKSLVLYLQQVGRGMRPKPDGHACIYLDHAANVYKHGLPDLPREWSLTAKLKRASAKSPSTIKDCPECLSIVLRTEPACPVCGHVFVPPGLRDVGIRFKDGDLVEIAGMRFDADVRLLPARDVIARAQTRDELEAVRLLYGYRPGWVSHIRRARRQKERRLEQQRRERAAKLYWANMERLL